MICFLLYYNEILGDPQELNAISEVFCKNRQHPLLIGSTKSNMGHPEPASGLAALSKLLIAIQDGHLPGIFIISLAKTHSFMFIHSQYRKSSLSKSKF